MKQTLKRKTLANYIDDFGNTYPLILVKMSKESLDTFSPNGVYTDQDTKLCSKLPFKPRRLIAEFSTGIFQYPVNKSQIITVTKAAVTAGASCVHLLGERWSVVGNAAVTGINYNTTVSYTAGETGEKETGMFDYTSDFITGTLKLGYSIEALPANLLGFAKDCMNNPDANGVCGGFSQGITPRHFVGKAKEVNWTKERQSYVTRKINVSDSEVVTDCASAQEERWNCLSYSGEDVRNVQLFT